MKIYLGFGEAERQIGKALRALNVPRHQFVLSTKIFFGSPTQIPTLKGLSRKHIIEGVKKSLRNLEYDYVDILFAHRPDDGGNLQSFRLGGSKGTGFLLGDK